MNPRVKEGMAKLKVFEAEMSEFARAHGLTKLNGYSLSQRSKQELLRIAHVNNYPIESVIEWIREDIQESILNEDYDFTYPTRPPTYH